MVKFRPMTRQKHQRPEVYATGKRERLWKVEYREYFIGTDGKEHSRHKSKTWSAKDHTKKEAQKLCDAFMSELQAGPQKADGSMTLEQFWTKIYRPIRSRRWTGNTAATVDFTWGAYVKPKLGDVPLNSISKAMVEIHLNELSDKGLSYATVNGARVRIRSVLEEAFENDYIPKNPARKIETPECAPGEETRSLTEQEVQALWGESAGRDYIVWRLLVLAGLRIGELLAMGREALRADGLDVSRTYIAGVVKLPKRNKARLAAIPASLRAELADWLATHESRLMFPSEKGEMMDRGWAEVREIQERGRKIIPDLTFRMCRTTFATLFEGDEVDRSSIMGHTDVDFTRNVYRKAVMDRRQKSVEDLDKRLKVVRIDRKPKRSA